MKKVIALIALALVSARADTLDLGPNGESYDRGIIFNQLNGTTLVGQHLSLDLQFNTSVHLFRGTHSSFLVGIDLLIDHEAAFMTGSGYLLDESGNQMGAPSPLGSAHSGNVMWVSLFPLWDSGLISPLNFFGVHFDLDLPAQEGSVAGAGLELRALDFVHNGRRSNPFRVGPHVPDSGTTLALLALGAVFIGAFTYCWRLTR